MIAASARSALRRLPLLLVLTAVRPAAAADPAIDLREHGIVALEQALLDCGTLGRVLNLAAHPDDEDGATLAACRHGRGLETSAVFANRGEGGQNEIGPELYRELGAIREVETVRATAREGAAPFFLGLEDFGYSKTAEETFARWGRERTVERVTYALRRLRPDVVFTNHDPDHGHGQHRALALAMREAFDRAARDDAFPEHFEEGLAPWEVTLLLERVAAPGDAEAPDPAAAGEETNPAPTVTLETDRLDPIRGTSFRDQAHRALVEHASQGRWTRFGPGRRTWRVVRRRHEAFLPPDADPFDPVELTRLRVFRAIAGGGVPRDVQALLLDPATFAPSLPRHDDRGALARALLDRRDALPALDRLSPSAQSLVDDLRAHARRLDRAAALALGVRLETRIEHDAALGPVERTRLVVRDPALLDLRGREPDEVVLERHGSRAAFLEPLWASPRYDAFDPLREDAALEVEVSPRGDQRTLLVRGGASYRARPAVTVDFAPRLRVLRDTGAAGPVESLAVVEVTDPLPSPLTAHLHAPDGEVLWSGALPTDARGTHLVPVRFERPKAQGGGGTLRLATEGGAESGAEDVVALHPLQVVPLEAKVRGTPAVGIVRSYDDTLEAALADLSVPARRLSARDLAFADLDRFDVILVDIRAYLVRDDLVRFNERLLEFASRGGTVGVFYQKTGEWNRDGDEDQGLAPFPLRVTRARVVDEAAPVTLLRPDHPLLSTPNRLDEADFAGWVHERGLYFPEASYDDRYVELLSCHDADEPPLAGGLLVARTGAGWYVYTAYAWYRQWRAGVPGAYRFLANLVSLRGERPERQDERPSEPREGSR